MDLQDVSEALEAAEQGNAGALALATDLLPQVLSRPARQQDTVRLVAVVVQQF